MDVTASRTFAGRASTPPSSQEHQEAARLTAQLAEQARERGKRFGRDLDQGNGGRIGGLRGAHARAQQRRLAHAARTPQQHIMRRVTGGETGDVGGDDLLLRVDALEEIEWGGDQLGHRARRAIPDIGGRAGPVGRARRRRRDAFQRSRDPGEGISRLAHPAIASASRA